MDPLAVIGAKSRSAVTPGEHGPAAERHEKAFALRQVTFCCCNGRPTTAPVRCDSGPRKAGVSAVRFRILQRARAIATRSCGSRCRGGQRGFRLGASRLARGCGAGLAETSPLIARYRYSAGGLPLCCRLAEAARHWSTHSAPLHRGVTKPGRSADDPPRESV